MLPINHHVMFFMRVGFKTKNVRNFVLSVNTPLITFQVICRKYIQLYSKAKTFEWLSET